MGESTLLLLWPPLAVVPRMLSHLRTRQAEQHGWVWHPIVSREELDALTTSPGCHTGQLDQRRFFLGPEVLVSSTGPCSTYVPNPRPNTCFGSSRTAYFRLCQHREPFRQPCCCEQFPPQCHGVSECLSRCPRLCIK